LSPGSAAVLDEELDLANLGKKKPENILLNNDIYF